MLTITRSSRPSQARAEPVGVYSTGDYLVFMDMVWGKERLQFDN